MTWLVAKVPLAVLRRGVARLGQQGGDGHLLWMQARRRPGPEHLRQPGPHRVAARHHPNTARCAGGLGVEAEELHALGGHLVDVRRGSTTNLPSTVELGRLIVTLDVDLTTRTVEPLGSLHGRWQVGHGQATWSIRQEVVQGGR